MSHVVHSDYSGLRSHDVIAMVARIAMIIFAVELLIMVSFDTFAVDLSSPAKSILDAVLLTTLTSPLIYVLVAQPFVDEARIARIRLEAQLNESGRLLAKTMDLQDSLRTASADVVVAHEQVLQKVGADLHDGPAQLLAYVLLRLETLERGVASTETEHGGVGKLRAVMADAMRELRAISKGLALPQLSELPLQTVIQRAAVRPDNEGKRLLTFDLPEAPIQLSPAHTACVYRLVQEALTNAYKHAQARRVHVSLMEGDPLVLTVRDDGRGFDPQVPSEGLGLNGMRARVRALGGEFAITSGRETRGTEIVVRIPAT